MNNDAVILYVEDLKSRYNAAVDSVKKSIQSPERWIKAAEKIGIKNPMTCPGCEGIGYDADRKSNERASTYRDCSICHGIGVVLNPLASTPKAPRNRGRKRHVNSRKAAGRQ